MHVTATRARRASTPADDARHGGRGQLAARTRALPNGRAVVGGFLVAVAAITVFAAQRAADRPPTTHWVVAAGQLTPGRRLVPGDIRIVTGDLPEPTAAKAFHHVSDVVGKVLVSALSPGELVQVSSVAPFQGAGPGEREVSFAVDPARSLGDRLVVGDVIDILATEGQGGELRATPVVAGVRIIDRQGRSGSLGGSSGYIYTVALANPNDVTALTAAAAGASLSVVRSTVAASGGQAAPYDQPAGAPRSPAATTSTTRSAR